MSSYTSYATYKLLVEEIAHKVSKHYGLAHEDVLDFLMKEMGIQEKDEMKDEMKEVKKEVKKEEKKEVTKKK